MATLDYVSDASNDLARELERRFQELQPEAGILFISVNPVPRRDGRCETFNVCLGFERHLDVGTGLALAKYTLHDEIARGLNFRIAIHRGIPGAARGNVRDEEARRDPT